MPKQIAHIVFFSLKQPTDEARQALVDSCHKYLAHQPGVVYFSAGERGAEFDRPVNDDQYDVGLHVVFESRAAHDAYQQSAEHVEFVNLNKPTWSALRVFDTWV